MRNLLETVTLKTGEEMLIEHVIAPDSVRKEQIRPFLQHKGSHWNGHIAAALEGECDELETHFYIGLIDDEMVGNIMTVESRGVGIFGHVNTLEAHRRKGICSHIMKHQMEDFRTRNGRVLLLGTGYQSAAYYIYASYEFKDWESDPGCMRYDNPVEPDFESRFFAHAPTKVAPAEWRQWALVALLAHIPFPDVRLRSVLMNVWGVALLEGQYCKFMAETIKDPGVSAYTLESETDAVVAFATCVPDSRWRREVNLLDIFYHPNYTRLDLLRLLEAIPFHDKPTHCYTDPRDREKIAALEQIGFRRAAVIPRLFTQNSVYRDGWLFLR